VTEFNHDSVLEMANEVRLFTAAPLILLETPKGKCDPMPFDLVIPWSTPRDNWIYDIAVQIAYSRELCRKSAQIQIRAQALSREASALCEKSKRERARSRR
jgi:hypothetical protein